MTPTTPTPSSALRTSLSLHNLASKTFTETLVPSIQAPVPHQVSPMIQRKRTFTSSDDTDSKGYHNKVRENIKEKLDIKGGANKRNLHLSTSRTKSKETVDQSLTIRAFTSLTNLSECSMLLECDKKELTL